MSIGLRFFLHVSTVLATQFLGTANIRRKIICNYIYIYIYIYVCNIIYIYTHKTVFRNINIIMVIIILIIIIIIPIMTYYPVINTIDTE